nr:immunoglobulin heavy chain junction region [Mus musculus]
CAGHFDYW